MSVPTDVLIVGAGFAGMYMLHRCRQLGFSAKLVEAGGDVGGTWYWNRYPGARCDVESMEYSYAFDEDLQQQWHWAERFAAQPEILRYAGHVAERFDLRRDMRFNTRVLRAWFDEESRSWSVGCDDGVERRARFLVMATGCLSSANLPSVKGRETFQGASYHTGQWPHQSVDFSGQRVAVIGTGSSAIQSIPVIAEQARELWVLQRTAAYSVPARNAPLDEQEEAAVKADYRRFRSRNAAMITAFGAKVGRNDVSALAVSEEQLEAQFERRWSLGGLNFMTSFNDLLVDKRANDLAAEFVRDKIRAVVQDPVTADLLSPRQIIGCKRLCLDSGYFETFNAPHVHLLDIAGSGVEEINASGLRAAGQQVDLDAIVFATGFDAMTGSLLKIEIRGRGGVELRQAWAAGPRTYLGLSISGFPNLFTISGPGSPSVLTNMIVSIEQHVNWIGDCLAWMSRRGHRSIEASAPAQQDWVAHVNAVADSTLFPGCNSWYLGANVPGKTRVFMPLLGFPPYVEKCNEVAARGYEGFALA
jgi:cation diffusion facilitator CzcD-associated flavoprotein CzcO